MKLRGLLLAGVALGAASLLACLGRTGIGVDDLAAAGGETPGDDASIDSSEPIDSSPAFDSSPVDSAKDSPRPDTPPPPPDSIDFFDIIPIPDGGPIGACASCVRDHCRDQVNACLNDPGCRSGMLCTLMTCIAGGGGTPDFACVLGCFGGDFGKAAKAISAFTCVISNCGSTCGGFFGGDAGGPPPPSDGGPSGEAGGSAGGGGSGGGAAWMSSDHAWTPEEVMSIDPSTRMSFSPEAFDAWRDQLYGQGCAPH